MSTATGSKNNSAESEVFVEDVALLYENLRAVYCSRSPKLAATSPHVSGGFFLAGISIP